MWSLLAGAVLCSAQRTAAFVPRAVAGPRGRGVAARAARDAGPREQRIVAALTEALSPTHLDVLNESHGSYTDESHFKVVVVSEAFEGAKLIKRHRMVTAAIADPAGALDFHSLSIAAAKTPVEWDPEAVPASPKCAGGDGRGMLR